MGVKVKTSGNPPRPHALTVEEVRRIALATMSQTTTRTHQRGLDIAGRPFKKYATRALKMYARSSTGRALAPKGGESFAWVRGPKQRDGSYDGSRIGQEAGRFYAGGYRAYKLASRKGLTNRNGAAGVEVDLVLSGDLARSYRVVNVTSRSFRVGVTGPAQLYAGHVDEKRPFMGLSPDDADEVQRVIVETLEGRRGTR